MPAIAEQVSTYSYSELQMEELKNLLGVHGQQHLLPYLDALSSREGELAHLCTELSQLDFQQLLTYFKRAHEAHKEVADKCADFIDPPLAEDCGGVSSTPEQLQLSYRETGLRSIAAGKVAVLLLAGGQGTRLGVEYPKGMYNVGLPSGKTLYQLQGERICRIQHLAEELTGQSGIVPWYIMTSEATKESTSHFFESNNFFGLSRENIVIFEQSTLPCMTKEGKLIIEAGYKVAKAPDGNGGLYKALRDSKVLDDMVERGIQYVHVYCVDNILIKMADPVFIGFCIHKSVKCGAKVVEKRIPNEAVGIVCRVNHKYQVVEYSEIPESAAQKRTSDGRLKYRAGSICNHFFTIDFLKEVVSNFEDQLKHHVATKKIPYIDSDGELVKPTSPNGIKLEKFVFDVFPFAGRVAVWEVERDEEFSPLKNADGADKDTPTTARRALCRLHRSQIVGAGGSIVNENENQRENTEDSSLHDDAALNGKGDSEVSFSASAPEIILRGRNGSCTVDDGDKMDGMVEISPLVSYSGEDLELLVHGKVFHYPVLISAPHEKLTASQTGVATSQSGVATSQSGVATSQSGAATS